MSGMDRRNFLKVAGGGAAALVVGGGLPWLLESTAFASIPVQTLEFKITDAMKHMVTHNAVNSATCYFWIFKEKNLPAECPGPIIFTTEGELISLKVTNDLDEPHAFSIPGVFRTGPIAPGATGTYRFRAPRAGSYIYYDNLNEPVNRVMGLHGAFIVMPKAPRRGHKFTPYSRPTASVQKLYDDFGTAHWPGLSWEQGDPATNTIAFRQYIWLLHQASPVLFSEVGNYTPGLDYPATQFVNLFNNDPYADTFTTGVFNRKPHFFTINGQSGHFVHNDPFSCPNNRVGEPVLIRILNAGLVLHSMHIHANHVFVTGINGVCQSNPLWVDTFTVKALDTVEYTVPYMRPPDIPNQLGIGRADLSKPLFSVNNPPAPGAPGTAHPVWPPVQELNTFIPAPGALLALGLGGNVIDLAVQLSPLCYPMHDHSEASQGAQGGNYNCGLISGINFIGDRNTPDPVTGGVTTFPDPPTTHGPNATGPGAGTGTGLPGGEI